MSDLNDRVALVTGSSQGIGKHTALALAGKGARVVLNARSLDKLDEAAEEIAGLGGQAVKVAGDVSTETVARKMVQAAMETWGRVDILVNNAGSGRARSGQYVPYTELSGEDWIYIMEQNLKSAHLCIQAVMPLMLAQKSGSIINVSSVAGHTCEPGPAGEKLLAPIEPTYVAAKAGLNGLTRQLAKDLAPSGVRVNCVAPGVILSSQRLEVFWESKSEEQRQKVLRTIPLGRTGNPREVAGAITFLASDEASYITGVTLDVNGGMFMAP